MKKRWGIRSVFSFLTAGVIAVGAVCPVKAESLADYSEKLHVMYEIAEVKAVDEASSYQVEWIQAEKEKTEQALLHSEIVSETLDAFGLRIETKSNGTEELLYLLDGGKSIGLDSSESGGIIYYCLKKDGKEIPMYSSQINVFPGHPGSTEQLIGDTSCADFSLDKELEFADRTQTADDMKKLLENIGGIDLEISRIYSLDRKTLQEHAEQRQERKAIEREAEESDYTENGTEEFTEEKMAEAEAYLIQLRQVVDGIPLADHCWTNETRPMATEMCAQAIVSEDCLEHAEIISAVTIKQEAAKSQLISPQEAESIYLEELKKTILVSDLYVENLELNYVVVQNGKQLEMIPAWIFCIAKEVKTDPVEPEGKDTVLMYDHMVINAETGERILNVK